MRRSRGIVLLCTSLGACLPEAPPLPGSPGDSTSGTSDDDADASSSLSSGSSTGDPSGGGGSAASPTTSDGSDSTEGDDPDATTLPPIDRPDVGVDLENCSVWAQDCPDGWKCMPWANDGGSAWNDTRCTPVAPDPGQAGDPCTVEGTGVSGYDDCTIGTMCWNVSPETNGGTCIAMCTGSEDDPVCEDPATTCSISNEGALVICLPVCDPLAQDCGTGQGCYPKADGDGFVCTPDASNEEGTYPAACSYVNACAPGHACLDADMVPGCATGCCSPWCDTSAADPCPAIDPSLACISWYPGGDAPPGYENVGVCAIPQ